MADARQHLPAIQRRQPDVEQDRVGPLVMEDPQPLPAVGDGGHVEARPVQHHLDGQRDVWIILDAQDLGAHGRIGR